MTSTTLDGIGHSQLNRTTPYIQASGISKIWGKGSGAYTALSEVSIEIDGGELCALVGPSGSGKSTLGALLAGIDRPTGGTMSVGGTPVHSLNERKLTRWRARHVGIVFQDFHLLPTLTVFENVAVAVELSDVTKGKVNRVKQALQTVDMASMSNRLPHELSGGQQQRVAIARVIAKTPNLVVADEPTGSLDQKNGQQVFELLRELANGGTTVVFITHDHDLAMRCDQTISIVDGQVSKSLTNVLVDASDPMSSLEAGRA